MNSSLVNMFTDRFHVMAPETEDLLGDGTQLVEGMVVLVEEHFSKVDPSSSNLSVYDQQKLRENNRWCEVTQLKITPRYGEDGHAGSPLVSFVALYADGTKAKRTYDSSYAWFVKKDSLPKKETFPEPGKLVPDAVMDSIKRDGVDSGYIFDLPDGLKQVRSFTDNRVLGQVTNVSEDEDGLKVEGVLNEEGMAFVKQDAELSMETQNDVDEEDDDTEDAVADLRLSMANSEPVADEGSGEHEDHDNIRGPLVKAMEAEFRPQVREERTITEHVVRYGPGHIMPRRSLAWRPFDRD